MSSFSRRNFSYSRYVTTRVQDGENIPRFVNQTRQCGRQLRGNLRSRRCNERTGRTKLGRGSDGATYMRFEPPLLTFYIAVFAFLCYALTDE